MPRNKNLLKHVRALQVLASARRGDKERRIRVPCVDPRTGEALPDGYEDPTLLDPADRGPRRLIIPDRDDRHPEETDPETADADQDPE